MTDEERAEVCGQLERALRRGLEIGIVQGELMGRLAMAREIEWEFGVELPAGMASGAGDARLH